MIDLHSHLLFGVDDGARDHDATCRMLERYAAQSVTAVAATSHSMVLSDEYRRRFDEVLPLAEKVGIQLFPGREYFLADAGEQYRELQTLGGGGVLLLDLQSFSVGDALSNRLGEFPCPLLLAHPERLWKNSALANARFLTARCNCFFQLNSGSFFGSYGRSAEKAAWALLDGGFCSVIASDAHHENEIDLAECRKLVSDYASPETAKLLFETNPQRVLAGRIPLPALPEVSFWTKIRRFFRG